MTFKILTISAALALAGTNVSAQTTNAWLTAGSSTSYDQAQYRVPYQDGRRAAYDNGYRDGLRRGEEAARSNRQFNVERERDYRDAESGYNRSYGDRDRYRDDYRGGFSQGYRDGYYRSNGNGNYGYGNGNGNYGYGNGRGRGNGRYNPNYGNGGYGGYGNSSYGAYQNGAADGYRKGLEDLQDRKAPDVTRQKWYRSGDHDYDRAYGSKEAYKVEYRRGFQEGYNRAYREGRRY
jgi:hypothetical protein